MAQVSDARIALAALRAGFPADEIPTAVAVAIAESDGDPNSVGTNKAHDGFPVTHDLGIWQINDYFNADKLRTGDWRDVDQNGRMAKAVWDDFLRADHDGWRGWATYNFGRYIQYLKRGQDAYRGLYRFTLRRYLMNHPQAQNKDQLDHGSDVLALQRAIGMAHADQDGYFGPITEQHVKQFQAKHNLAVDGVVGPITAKALGWGWAG